MWYRALAVVLPRQRSLGSGHIFFDPKEMCAVPKQRAVRFGCRRERHAKQVIQEVKKVKAVLAYRTSNVSWRYPGSLQGHFPRWVSLNKCVCACVLLQDASSPPRSVLRPSTFAFIRGPSRVGGTRLSRFMRRLVSRTAAGVLLAGVRFHDVPNCACAGLGVMLRNSAKFRLFGVVGTKPPNACPLPPGVDNIEDGSGVVLEGGVDGACMGCLKEPTRTGVGDVAKYMSRFASFSP